LPDCASIIRRAVSSRSWRAPKTIKKIEGEARDIDGADDEGQPNGGLPDALGGW
jgi:hypothetical protein